MNQKTANAVQSNLIIKPSSLNYKITLKQAVEDYIKKEAKIEDFEIGVNDEDQFNAIPIGCLQDEFDDCLFQYPKKEEKQDKHNE